MISWRHHFHSANGVKEKRHALSDLFMFETSFLIPVSSVVWTVVSIICRRFRLLIVDLSIAKWSGYARSNGVKIPMKKDMQYTNFLPNLMSNWRETGWNLPWGLGLVGQLRSQFEHNSLDVVAQIYREVAGRFEVYSHPMYLKNLLHLYLFQWIVLIYFWTCHCFALCWCTREAAVTSQPLRQFSLQVRNISARLVIFGYNPLDILRCVQML